MVMREEVLYKIFLDLHKSYDALYLNLCLDILAANGVVPQYLRLLRQYWDWLTMVPGPGDTMVHCSRDLSG